MFLDSIKLQPHLQKKAVYPLHLGTRNSFEENGGMLKRKFNGAFSYLF
jgi:hypothetical protein